MTHLTVDEFTDFVSINKLDEESLELASKVNTHIGECEDCLRKLRAFQLVYDELKKIGNTANFRDVLYTVVKNSKTAEGEACLEQNTVSPQYNGIEGMNTGGQSLERH